MTLPASRPGRRALRRLLVLALSLLLLPACNTVEFYELEALSDPVMDLDEGPARAHFLQKVLYSMEGTAGGIGTAAGGGCGCY